MQNCPMVRGPFFGEGGEKFRGGGINFIFWGEVQFSERGQFFWGPKNFVGRGSNFYCCFFGGNSKKIGGPFFSLGGEGGVQKYWRADYSIFSALFL